MTNRFVSLAVFAYAFCTLLAQDPRGGITGTVVDETGAFVPGVKVRATNLETGVPASAETNQSGQYRLPYLPAGFYRVNAEVTGFKSFIRDKVEVRVGEMLDLQIRMEVGSLTETVQVTAETPVLETANASLGQTIDNRRIQELPQRGGNPLELALLTPGVVNATNMRLRKAMAPEATSDITADGAGRFNNEFQVDGITNVAADRGSGYGRVAFSPPQAAVREFKMQTSAYDASIGHTMGALLNVSTASGTNEFHGQLQYFLRHKALDAPNFFNNKNGTTQSVYQDHRYGAAIGGPLSIPGLYSGRNRTFWFYTYEKNNFGVPVQWTRTVPTAAQRQGDFSALLRNGSVYQIYDPFTTRPAAQPGRFERSPFPNNIIPANRIDPLGQAIANLYPLPNQPGTADGRNNYFLANKALQDYYVHLLRLDHAFSENHRAFLRLHYDFWKEKKNNDFGNWLNGIHQNRPNRGVALDDVIVISPNLVLNLRYGLTSTKWWQYRVSRGFDLAGLGFSPNLLQYLDAEQSPLPRITPGAYSQISWWENPGDGVNSSLTHSFQGTVTRLFGAHSLRAGAEVRVLRSFNNRRPIGVAPDLSFNTNYTRGPLDTAAAAPIGQDLASMLLGIPAGSMEVVASSALQNQFYGFYVHDDWRVTPKFTLNIGVRYELETPLTERYDRLVADYDRTTPNPIEAQARANYARNPIPELSPEDFAVRGGLTWIDVNERSPYAGETNNIMPRIGFTYALTQKTILRGGYGLFFDTLGILKTLPYQTGFTQSTPIQASLDNGQTYLATLANPFPSGLIPPAGSSNGLETNLGQAIDYYYRDMKQAYSQRWSFGIQRELPALFMIDVSYVGNRATRSAVERNINVTPAKYLSRSPVRDQARIDYLGQQFPNPFRGTNPIYGANISRANLLRPYPQFGDINAFEPIGYSWYHSMQVRAERRFAQGFTFQLAYTWSKTMEATEFLNPQDPTPSEVISAYDRPHRIAGSGIWEVPVGKGRKFANRAPGVLNAIIGGWQVGSVLSMQSGAPLGFGNAILLTHPNDVRLGEPDVDMWFNTSAFNRAAAQQLASNYRELPLRFSGIRSDGQFAIDMSFSKYFDFTERTRLQFRADSYNFTNTTSFANPNTTPTNTAFGRVTATQNDARNWQLALRLIF
jgi:hypothetical protein